MISLGYVIMIDMSTVCQVSGCRAVGEKQGNRVIGRKEGNWSDSCIGQVGKGRCEMMVVNIASTVETRI